MSFSSKVIIFVEQGEVDLKKHIICIQSISIIVLILILVVILANPHNIGRNIINALEAPSNLDYIEYGDNFTGIELSDCQGNKIDSLPHSNKYTILTYLSDSCSSCLDAISDFNRFSEVYGEELNYVILWIDDIPTSYLRKNSVDEMINYSLKGKTKLSTSTPTYYILDESNTIVFKDTNRENLLKKISDLGLVSSSTLIANANRYISENFFDGNSDKRKVLYFYMPGCPDCEAANTLLRENDLDEKFDIAYVYKYDTMDSSKIIDKDKLFASVYGITWYPSFLVLTGSDYRLVGETPAEDLIAELSK